MQYSANHRGRETMNQLRVFENELSSVYVKQKTDVGLYLKL